MEGMASRSLQKLSLMWSRRFRSNALWCARLSVEPPPRLLKNEIDIKKNVVDQITNNN
jgi:hypothetical protein